MGLRDALRSNENTPVVKQQKVFPEKGASVSVIHKKKKKKHNHRNLKQIFILSFDALRERKARSALTILMVVVGSALMVALNGLGAGASDFISKQLNFLAPNVIFVSPGQIGFRGGPSAPPTIVFNAEVVKRENHILQFTIFTDPSSTQLTGFIEFIVLIDVDASYHQNVVHRIYNE